MKTSTLLRKSLKVLKEEGWTKGPLARNKYRHAVLPTNLNATKFCALGSLCKVTGYSGAGVIPAGYHDAMQLLNRTANKNTGYGGIVSLNEDPSTVFEDVEKVFKRAIKSAQTQGN